MTAKESISTQIEQIASDTGKIIERMAGEPGLADPITEKWLTTCSAIPHHLQSGYLKIAVAGSIKSGKSTLINALLGKDLVQRGAGVVTAMTTRIRKGKKHLAKIHLKSWDEINADIQEALTLFPESETVEADNDVKTLDAFDIRRQHDRSYLFQSLERLKTAIGPDSGGLRPETVLIQNALEGYERAGEWVQADACVLEFSGKSFSRHKTFSADPSMAIFVRDIELDVPVQTMDSQVEIADCQGADSIDSRQLMHIQNYLESVNLILYVISSRTGLREADTRFISLIKSMGLAGHMVFVNNVDISEHQNMENMAHVSRRIETELALLVENPRLYSFSCLYELFEKTENTLPAKDRKRLSFWREDKKITSGSRKETDRFLQDLSSRLDKDRFNLLAANPLKRVELILHAASKKLSLYTAALSEDSKKSDQALEEMIRISENAQKIEAIVEHSLTNTTKSLEQKVRKDINLFFSKGNGQVHSRLDAFIKSYAFNLESYDTAAAHSGVPAALYLMFQDFKAAFDSFVAREIYPQLTGFVSEIEDQLSTYYGSLFNSYQIELRRVDLLSGQAEHDRVEEQEILTDALDFAGLKRILGLSLPVLTLQLRYSARIKLSAFAGFGAQSLMDIASRIFNKPGANVRSTGLSKAAISIKVQCIRALPAQLENYKHQLMEQFLVPLIQSASREFGEIISQGYQLYDTKKEEIEEQIHKDRGYKKEQGEDLDQMLNDINKILVRIEKIALV